MKDFPWLTAIGVVPLVGALAVSLMPASRLRLAKQLAIAFSLVSLALTIGMITQFESGAAEQFQLVEQHQWIKAFGIQYKVGVDGLALVLIALTAFLVPVVLLASWNVDNKVKSYFALILLLETAMIGVFAAIDVFLFYALFEVMLVPMYFLIGVWGGERRVYAAVKFFLYTLLAGLLMLVAVLTMYFLTRDAAGAGTFDYEQWLTLDVARNTQRWLFLGFFVAFAVKVPLFPFHTWLPDAHTEAPTGGSVLLAGVMLKIGTFGFMRYSIPLFPEASRYFAPMMMGLGLFGIFYGALVAIVQKDIKRLVAYTSIAHLGFIILGTFAFTRQGQSGAVLYMVNHGLSTGALFLIIGFLYERRHTRLIEEYGGLRSVVPVLAATFLVAGLSSLALPGLNGFVSEFLVLLGTYSRHPVLGIIATFGIILAALYILVAYQRTMQGPVTVEANRGMADLDLREKLVIAPVLLVIIVLGVYPAPVLRVIEPSVQRVMERVEKTDPAPTIESATGEQK
ncbi:MAG TPA: NADH-quinone oxidoreductase subunit M [Mycobacteriales bacterium]|jgi:NADH-quinone oxidoreductase subunit M|nr:NADH-quinone oxidoreductase subunit M [Mycobacteriales bacterium]